MSFIAAMVSSLKSNKRERTSAFKKLENAGGLSGKLHFDKKASKKQLNVIKEKLQEENKKTLIKNSIIFTVLVCVFIYFFAIHKY
ncbi:MULTISPECIES: hypothetical protein [Tenacibaculum]|uniref:hypothetical protein n=1 Tax=Tenacibaculum TaxID=104267 RepID=UPI001F0B5557|nr:MULTISPECIES: hypothetical protein [Tenacibaculum]MCH3881047.1 hypothetical protein [Tenacibaculum aquimarinum]MCH3884085.1 hypothetical protein [Tenacibaculum aquimarinum]MDO6599353.1 hypothetical protein [Tenacibaculum sp. 1_MG-2023]